MVDCQGIDARLQSNGENDVGDDDRDALKDDGLERSVIQIGNVQHPDVDELRELRQEQFEPGKKRRGVESPL